MAVMAGWLVCEGRGSRGVVYVAVVLSVLEPIWSSLYKRENELYLRHKPIYIQWSRANREHHVVLVRM